LVDGHRKPLSVGGGGTSATLATSGSLSTSSSVSFRPL
jgi:hypothetical protein